MAEELSPGSAPAAVMELLAGADVQKLGMVCALPPKPLQVRQLAPGGWAEECGVMLGDVVTEVNGIPACSIEAEDLKKAMSARPLHFRLVLASPARGASQAALAENSKVSVQDARFAAATRIQSWCRGYQVRGARRSRGEAAPDTKNVDEVCESQWRQKMEKFLEDKFFTGPEDEAALKIQRTLRGWNLRRRSFDKNVGKVLVAAGTGGEVEKSEEAEMEMAGMSQFCEATPEQNSATKIQKVWRGWHVRDCIRIILSQQAESLSTPTPEEVPSQRKRRLRSASRISPASSRMGDPCEEAAVKIQSVFRGSCARRSMMELEDSPPSMTSREDGDTFSTLSQQKFEARKLYGMEDSFSTLSQQKLYGMDFGRSFNRSNDAEEASNDADSTTGTDADTYQHSELDTIDTRSWQQDSKRPSLLSVASAAPPSPRLELLDQVTCRAVPGFSLEADRPIPTPASHLQTPAQCHLQTPALPGQTPSCSNTLQEQMQDIAEHMRTLTESPASYGVVPTRPRELREKAPLPTPGSTQSSAPTQINTTQQAEFEFRRHGCTDIPEELVDESTPAQDDEWTPVQGDESPWISECGDMTSCSDVAGHLPDNIVIVEAFKVMLLKKEHGFVRAWRNILDTAGRGRITFNELCEACRRVGFRGSIKDLWRQLDPMDLAGITLQEFDYDSAETLGRFHAALVARYGTVRAATKSFGLTGARRLQQNEFISLMRSQGFMRKHEAGALFRTLCICPPVSSLDRDGGISVRDFEWLHGVSKHLPQVLPERVQPGMAPESATTDFYDVPESVADSEDELESNPGGTVFEKLYQNAIELKERQQQKVAAETDAQRALTVGGEANGPVDPHRFERLFQEAQVKREEKERRTEKFYQNFQTQQGPKHISGEVWERLVKPKEKSEAETVEDAAIRPARSTCWDSIPVAQIRTSCEQEGFDTKGKTKEELLEFLKQRKQKQAPKSVPMATFRQQKLYLDHERQLRALEKKRIEAAAREEKEIEDLQLKPRQAVRKNLHERLYAEAENIEKRRQEEVDRAAAKADAVLAAVQPKGPPVKDETFLRLHVDGNDRHANNLEKKKMLEKEKEDLLQACSVHRNKTADPQVFDRLYAGKKRGEEASSTQDTDEASDEEEAVPLHLREATYDTAWGGKHKVAPKSLPEELKGMLRKKAETVEHAQRRSITTADAAPGVRRSSSSSSLPSAASKKQPCNVAIDLRAGAAARKVSFKRDSQELARGDCLASENGLLRDFAKFFFSCLPTVEAAIDAFDMNKTGRISTASFIGGMKRLRYQGDAKSVFRALDVECSGYVGKRELQVLNKFHPHLKLDSDVARSDSLKGRNGAGKHKSSQLPRPLQKTRSSSTPSLSLPDRHEHLETGPAVPQGDEAYPYKGRARMMGRNGYAPSSSPEPVQPARTTASRLPAPPRQSNAPGPAQAQASELAESSRYPYKGRSADSNSERYVSKIPMPRAAPVSQPGKLTPGFGEMGQSGTQRMLGTADSVNRSTAISWPISPTMLDVCETGSRANETVSVYDDESRVYDDESQMEPDVEVCINSEASDSDDDSCSPTIGSRSCASRGPIPIPASKHHAACHLNAKPSTSLVGTESSTGSHCSTPRSLDEESMPWQEGPRSSSASSTSGPWLEGATLATSGSNNVAPSGEGADCGELQAEVRQLLLQYKLDKLDKQRACPEVGSAQQRQLKEACGPELSSKSAWIPAQET